MNYEETINYLFTFLPMFQRIGAAAYKADLSNTIALMEALDNPQNNFKTIHIAGTNGKGSTTHLLASLHQQVSPKHCQSEPLQVFDQSHKAAELVVG